MFNSWQIKFGDFVLLFQNSERLLKTTEEVWL